MGSKLFVWPPRLAAVIVASGWLVAGPAATAPGWEWLRLQLILSIFAVWIALDGLARDDTGTWTGAEAAAYQCVILLTAGAILLFTHNAKFMELAVIVGCGMFGIAVVATLGGCDTSGAVSRRGLSAWPDPRHTALDGAAQCPADGTVAGGSDATRPPSIYRDGASRVVMAGWSVSRGCC